MREKKYLSLWSLDSFFQAGSKGHWRRVEHIYPVATYKLEHLKFDLKIFSLIYFMPIASHGGLSGWARGFLPVFKFAIILPWTTSKDENESNTDRYIQV